MRLIDAHSLAAHFMCLPPDYYHTSYIVGEIMAAPTVHALGNVKEQEPRVMTLDELTEIYVEFKGAICPIRLSNFDLQKIIIYVNDGICRLWVGKPTDEQMKAVKWNADD